MATKTNKHKRPLLPKVLYTKYCNQVLRNPVNQVCTSSIAIKYCNQVLRNPVNQVLHNQVTAVCVATKMEQQKKRENILELSRSF